MILAVLFKISQWQLHRFSLVLFVCSLWLYSPYTFCANDNTFSIAFLSQSERTQLQALLAEHKDDITIVPFAEQTVSENLINIGSWLLTKGYATLGQKVLNQALRYAESYSDAELGYIYNLLANTAESNLPQAINWYEKAIELGNLSACVNLGVFYEKQQQYDNAANIYNKCTMAVDQVDIVDKETVALAYLNLGSLYYNGVLNKDNKHDQQVAGKLWQASYELNPYDLDIHYNLAIYNRYVLKNFTQARYHLTVCAWSLTECLAGLNDYKLAALSSEQQHLLDLLKAQGAKKEHILSDRAKYWLPELAYLNFRMPYGEMNTITNEDEIIGIKISFTNAHSQKAIATINRLVFVDMFSEINALTYSWSIALKPRQMEYLGQKIKLEAKSGQWIYQILFKE